MEDLLTAFRWRLAETIVWCESLGSLADPVNSLRTPSLEPAVRWTAPGVNGFIFRDWGDANDKRAMLLRLSETRADLLRAARLYPDSPATNVGNGRLLISDPEDSLTFGFSAEESLGFIDSNDVLPWDTWFWYEEEPAAINTKSHAINRVDAKRHLFYWISMPFVPLVIEAIDVNVHLPVCFWWALEYKERDYDTPFLRLLDVEGFLK